MKFRIINPIIAALVFVSLFFVSTADAGEIKVHNTDRSKIAFVGEVVEGDAQMLRDYLVDHQEVTSIAFWSGGGLVTEGIEMMEIIKLRGLNTVIMDNGVCFSICAFMWLGGSERVVEGNGQLGVHQPFGPHEVALEMGPEAYKTMTMQTMAWKMYMVESLGIEVDNMWWMYVLFTAAEDMHVFTREELDYLEIK